MTRAGRFAGYGLMAAAVLVAAVPPSRTVDAIGPFPSVAVVLLVGMIGVMLVFTDLMVRGLYEQIDTAKRRDDEGE